VTSETISVEGRKLHCELTESSVQTTPASEPEVILLSFALEPIPAQWLTESGDGLWRRLRTRFAESAALECRTSNRPFIGRISFSCSGVPIECEFSELTDSEIHALKAAIQFAAVYPETVAIRILRGGSVRFSRPSPVKGVRQQRTARFIRSLLRAVSPPGSFIRRPLSISTKK